MPDASVSSSAARIRAPASRNPAWSSIMAPAQIAPDGFAMPSPAISGAEPWMGSKREGYDPSGLRLAEGAIPIAPAMASDIF